MKKEQRKINKVKKLVLLKDKKKYTSSQNDQEKKRENIKLPIPDPRDIKRIVKRMLSRQ